MKRLKDTGALNAIGEKAKEITGALVECAKKTVAKIGEVAHDVGNGFAKTAKNIARVID